MRELCNTAAVRTAVVRETTIRRVTLRSGGARAVLTAMVSAAVISCAAAKLPPSATGPALGRALPEFTRRALGGETVSSGALRGKIVVVEFFAQYCKPCWKALPQVQKLVAEQAKRADGADGADGAEHAEVAVIGIGEDEFASDTDLMARQLGLTFPVLHDAGNVLAGRFRVGQIPATLVLDRKGVVRWQARPGDGIAELRRAVAALREDDAG